MGIEREEEEVVSKHIACNNDILQLIALRQLSHLFSALNATKKTVCGENDTKSIIQGKHKQKNTTLRDS